VDPAQHLQDRGRGQQRGHPAEDQGQPAGPLRAAGGRGHRGEDQVAEVVPGPWAGAFDRVRAGEAEPGHDQVAERDDQGEQAEGQGRGQDRRRDRALAPDHPDHGVHDQAA